MRKTKKPHIFLQTRSRMAEVSFFRVRFSDKRSLASWDTDRLHHYNREPYPLEFLATDYWHRWQKYFISGDKPKPETAHEKSAIPCHSMPFLVFRRDHLRFWIICGPIWGSFPVWESFAVGDHLGRCTILLYQIINETKIWESTGSLCDMARKIEQSIW